MTVWVVEAQPYHETGWVEDVFDNEPAAQACAAALNDRSAADAGALGADMIYVVTDHELRSEWKPS